MFRTHTTSAIVHTQVSHLSWTRDDQSQVPLVSWFGHAIENGGSMRVREDIVCVDGTEEEEEEEAYSP